MRLQTRHVRRFSRIGLAVAGLLLASWLGWRAYVLTQLQPARARDDNSDYAARFCARGANDATAEWGEALAKLSPLPAFDEPPPAGMQWDFQRRGSPAPGLDWGDVRTGDWRPDERPRLRVWIRHMSSAAFNEPLERIADLPPGGFVWARHGLFTAGTFPDGVDRTPIREAARQFVARARLRAAQGDLAAAWEDLETVLDLAGEGPRELPLDHLVLTAVAALALEELRLLMGEHVPSAGLAEQIVERLREHDFAGSWRRMVHGQFDLFRMYADRSFAPASQGGYMVLSAQPVWNRAAGPSGSGATASPLWNVFTPLYNRRAGLEARVRRFESTVATCPQLPYAEARRVLVEIECRGLTSSADGNALHAASFDRWTRIYEPTLKIEAGRRAAIVMVGLARHAAERGRYPERLDELAGGLLERVPDDPFGDRPFGYARRGDDYVLTSCGPDADDDGGVTASAERREWWSWSDGDVLLSIARREHWEPEPVAVPRQPEASP